MSIAIVARTVTLNVTRDMVDRVVDRLRAEGVSKAPFGKLFHAVCRVAFTTEEGNEGLLEVACRKAFAKELPVEHIPAGTAVKFYDPQWQEPGTCEKCGGDGIFWRKGPAEDGKAPQLFPDKCYPCAGKGTMTLADVKRTTNYYRYFYRIPSM